MINILSLYILDNHDLHFVKEVNGEIRESVTEDGLLDKEDVAARLLDLLHYVEDVRALLAQHAVHGSIVGHNHLKAAKNVKKRTMRV